MPQDKPDFVGLTRFLLEPFLDSPQSLRVDCESLSQPRIWVRVAIEGEDKGRVFGRGGRNIQAVRTVLQSMGALSGYRVNLDVFGSQAAESESRQDSAARRTRSPRSGSRPKPRRGSSRD